MALKPEQQAIDLINRANHILVLTSEHPGIDGIASAVVFGLFLKQLKKTFDVVIPHWKAGALPTFLSNAIEIQSSIPALQTFELQINVKKTPLAELMYEVKEEKLNITLVPKQGAWSPSDVTVKPGESRFDLIVTLGCPDLHALGSIAKEQADFIYHTPTINIDHSASNEYWGQLNLVDLTAVSTTEVLYNWIQALEEQKMDEPIATGILAGMIAKTKSFRTNTVTPKALQTAADLVTRGAKREQIIHALWRTRSLATLKLWGRVLSRVEQDEETGLLWSKLSQSDFVESGGSVQALHGVVDELLAYAPQTKTIVVVSQISADQLDVRVYAIAPRSALDLTRAFSAEGTMEQARFTLVGHDLVQGTQKVIEQVKHQIHALGV